VDGPFEEELKDPSLPYRGSNNQRIIDMQKTLAKGCIVLHDKMKKEAY
jgi:anaerobic ribonucleoside-triphosphate reductase activating protein